MANPLNYLSLARKAGRVELGEEPVGAAARANHARLVVVASDASEHTWRRAESFVAGTAQSCIRVPFTKDELGMATGRTALALAAFTDPALALGFVQALGAPETYTAVLSELTERTQRVRRHQQEEKNHRRNQRAGSSFRKAHMKKN